MEQQKEEATFVYPNSDGSTTKVTLRDGVVIKWELTAPQKQGGECANILENGKIRKELLPEGGQSEIASFPKSPYTPTVYTLCKIINEGAIPSEPFFVFAANDEKEEAGALEIKEQFIPIPVDTLSFKDDFRVKQYVAKNPHYAFKSLSSGKSYLIVDVPKQEGSKKFFYTLESSYNPLLPSVSKYIMPEGDGYPEIEDHDGSVETGKASMNFKNFYNDPAETIKSVVHSYIFEEGVEDVFNSFFATKLREFLEQEGYRKS